MRELAVGLARSLTTRRTPRPLSAALEWRSAGREPSRADVGCSHWVVGGHRPYARASPKDAEWADESEESDDLFGDPSLAAKGLEPAYKPLGSAEEPYLFEPPLEEEAYTSTPQSLPPRRPRLPTSIKKLNRILSRHHPVEIREEDLEEKFIKGSGPGGQAINKTNSNVSLLHIPTGIRVFAQPTRMREQNRTAARRLLQQKLDALRAEGKLDEMYGGRKAVEYTIKKNGDEEAEGLSKKEMRKREEVLQAGSYSKDELRAEKERVRRKDRERKARKKRRLKEEEKKRAKGLGVDNGVAEEGEGHVDSRGTGRG